MGNVFIKFNLKVDDVGVPKSETVIVPANIIMLRSQEYDDNAVYYVENIYNAERFEVSLETFNRIQAVLAAVYTNENIHKRTKKEVAKKKV